MAEREYFSLGDYGLWRPYTDGSDRVHPVLDASDIGKNGESVLFFLPGMTVRHQDTIEIARYAREPERLLGNHVDRDKVDIVTMSYGIPTEARLMADKINAEDEFIESAMMRFARKYVLPVIERGATVTLFGQSAGTTAIESLRRCLCQIYAQEQGMDEVQIREKLNAVVAIHYSNISSAYSLKDTESKPDFTKVVMHCPQDLLAKAYNQKADELKPDEIPNDHARLDRLAGNGVLVTIPFIGNPAPDWKSDEPETPTYFYNDLKLLGKPFRDEDFGHTPNSARRHNSKFWTHSNSTFPIETNFALARTLWNGVTRTGPVDAMDLLMDSRHDLERNAQYSVYQGLSPQAHALSMAHPDMRRAVEQYRQEQEAKANAAADNEKSGFGKLLDVLQLTRLGQRTRGR